MLLVFEYSFEYFTAPGAVQYHSNRLVAKWGTNLDATAPNCVRVLAWRLMRRWGIPGTPLA
jgi:hypothetical protein